MRASPKLADFCKSHLACTGKVCPKSAASGRVLLHPGGPLLAFVPVTFDIYRPLKPRLRWAIQCLVSFADHAGRCFPSIRTFALHAGIDDRQRAILPNLSRPEVARKRRPGGVYVYRINPRFLPKWPKRKVSQTRDRKSLSLCRRRSADRWCPSSRDRRKPR